MKTLGLCMIIKDGEKYIEECIESVLPIISEIIIVDTGSTDSTLEKIKRFNPEIYQYEWNNNFAEARNISLQHAKSDYLIILDSDEVVYAEDLPKLMKAIEAGNADCLTIRFHNLTNENDENAFNIHEGLRIFKNGSYHFEGAIHEQPIFNYSDRKPVSEHSGVRIKHYGYLKSNTGEKKFNRNMTILKDVLEKNPEEPFHLFNMGNQYMSIGDYQTALEYYEKANKFKDITLAYSPHLIFRLASCLRSLKRSDECLSVIAEGLKIYSNCTDLEFLRGLTLNSMKRFTKAIDSFNKCIEMGQAPPNLCFFPDTSTLRPLIEVAEIYISLEDYEKALEYYFKALKVDGKQYFIIYKIVYLLNKILADKNDVYKNICALFADSNYKPNVMVMTDALLEEKLFEEASLALDKYLNSSYVIDDADTLFLKGKIQFYLKDYDAAYNNFKEAVDSKTSKGILPYTEKRSFEYLTVCSLFIDNCREWFIKKVESLENSLEKDVYTTILTEKKESLNNEAISVATSILSILLSVQEFDIFQKTLSILNLFESKEVLLRLADIYFENNFHDMAVKTILQSVKELDYLDSRAVTILNKKILI